MQLKYSAIVLCAGSGTRANLGYNKVLYELNEKPLFVYAVESFLTDEMCKQVIVVTKKEEREHFQKVLGEIPNVQKVVYSDGGSERSESVEKAIAYVKEESVLIHDAARLCVEQKDLKLLCEALISYDAALLGLPVVDTVKRVADGCVIGTEDRSTLFLAQTPQAFHVEALRHLIEKAKQDNYTITDEIMLVEHYQKDAKIKMLEGSKKYNKWTNSEDFGGNHV